MLYKKNINHGKKDRILFFIFFIIFLNTSTKIFPEEKISSSPLINMDQIKPSFEEVEDHEDNKSSNQNTTLEPEAPIIIIKKKKCCSLVAFISK